MKNTHFSILGYFTGFLGYGKGGESQMRPAALIFSERAVI